MLVEPEDIAAVKPDTLEDAVAVEQTMVKHRHFRIGFVDELSIEINLHPASLAARENFCPAPAGENLLVLGIYQGNCRRDIASFLPCPLPLCACRHAAPPPSRSLNCLRSSQSLASWQPSSFRRSGPRSTRRSALSTHPTSTLNANPRTFLWPGIIARGGILTDPKVYFSKLDPFYPATLPISIINSTLAITAVKNSLDPTFPAGGISPSYEFVGGLKTSDPASTPVAYTRGLQANGSWSPTSGTYRDVGGYVGFLSGNVEFYANTSTPAVFPSNNSGRKVASIQQGIPTTARLWAVPPPGTTTLGSATGVLAQRGP